MPAVVVCGSCNRRLDLTPYFEAVEVSKRRHRQEDDPDALRYVLIVDGDEQIPTVTCPEHGHIGPRESIERAITERITVQLHAGW